MSDVVMGVKGQPPMTRFPRWWGGLLVSGFLALVAVPASPATSKADEPRSAQSDLWEVKVSGHQDRPHSILPHITVREYIVEATPRMGGDVRYLRVGGDFLEALQPLKEIRIFEDRLVVTTHIHILVFDLRRAEKLKFLRVIRPISSSTGRFLAYNEWQHRSMPEEMLGSVVSVLDLQTMERRVVFPESESVREPRASGPPSEFEPYVTSWEEDPGCRCFASRFLWTADDSRLAFVCHFYLAREGWLPGRYDLRRYGVVVVSLNMNLDTSSHLFDIPKEIFRVPGVEVDTNQGFFPVQDTDWLSNDLLEIRMRSKPGLRERLVIDVAKNEVRAEP